MEHVGAISGGEWNSFSGMCSEEAEFMAQLLGNCSLPDDGQNETNFPVSSSFWLSNGNVSGVDQSTMYASDGTSSSMYSFSQGSSYEGYFPGVSHHVFVANNDLMKMEVEDRNNSYLVHIPSANVMGGVDMLNQEVSNDSIDSDNNMSEDVLQGKKMESKKRSRIPGEVQKNKRSVRINKCPMADDSEANNNNNKNGVVYRQNSSSCCSEDDSNASHEFNGVTCSSSSKGTRALNLAGKTRANRGSATDPQSLYARKRRERINERLRILQKLVPNGTKVDISTMLEEAVQYVKFLQLQIKLLSSDDMWMYAPIAYNGMDIGLDLKR